MNVNEKITRFTNLENDDSLSAFSGYTAQQSHFVYQIFFDFIKETKPKQILEIGTALGGFTQFLKIVIDFLNIDCTILSYDIYSKPWYSDLIDNGIDIRVENIFNNDYTIVKKEVIDFIKKNGTTIVLCDGGNKISEFKILSNYIKNSDFILAHDYSESEKIFNEKIRHKIWNWCEITEDDISDISMTNNLVPYNQNKFSECVWVCKQKKYE